MAKKSASLSFRAIVLGAEADVIRQALEARVEIDKLIEERQRAYERIAALETQVEEILGEQGGFPFPPPPLPIAGLDPKLDVLARAGGPVVKKAGRPAAEAQAGAAAAAEDAVAGDSDADGDDAGTPEAKA